MSTRDTLAVAAVALALSAGHAFAGEGNGGPFALRTPGFATQTSARADTGSENTPNLDATFTETAGQILLAGNAGEAPVQTANSLPRGALDGTLAYARSARPGSAARVTTAAR